MDEYRTPIPFYMTETYERMINQNTEKKEPLSEESSQRDYFRQMYPQNVKRYLRVIVEVLNRIDVKGSFLYDEYPDNVRLERLLETTLRLIPLENNMNRETQRNLVRVLLLEEVMWRRKKEIAQ